jgi:hypothetical protein
MPIPDRIAISPPSSLSPGLRVPRTYATCAYAPRRARAWRALYRQVGEVFVVAAVGPEAQSDPRGFERAVRRALQRLADLEED